MQQITLSFLEAEKPYIQNALLLAMKHDMAQIDALQLQDMANDNLSADTLTKLCQLEMALSIYKKQFNALQHG
jgi:hypothetical protein